MASNKLGSALKISLPIAIFFAAIISLGSWLYLRQFQPIRKEARTPTPSEVGKEDLAISSPNNETVLTDSRVKLSGQTFAGAILTAVNGKVSEIFEAGGDGKFEKGLNLEKGFNFLTVRAVKRDEDKVITRNLLLWVDEEANEDHLFAGSVKGILGSGLTLDTISGSRTIQLAGSTAIIGQSPKEATQTAAEQVKVGNFLIALGNIENDSILKAKRVAIFDQSPSKLTEGLFGTITKIDEGEITLSLTQTKARRTIIAGDGTSIIVKGNLPPKVTNFSVGDFLVAVIKDEDGKQNALKILLIPKSGSPEATKESR